MVALVGCSADGIHSTQKFFPGSQLTAWNDCSGSKFESGSNSIAICAQTGINPVTQVNSYNITFFLPSPAHVVIAAFDDRASLLKVVYEADVPATLPGQFPTVAWDFTDAAGRPVPSGDYRLYFKAGDYVSTSDVNVP